MSVGKDSILRAANADAKKTEVKAEAKPAEEVKEPVKAEEAPAAKKAPAKRTTAAKKTTTAKRTTAAKKPAAKKAPAKKEVKTSVLTPQNTEELEAAFVKGTQPEKVDGPVHIKDELPVYLL